MITQQVLITVKSKNDEIPANIRNAYDLRYNEAPVVNQH